MCDIPSIAVFCRESIECCPESMLYVSLATGGAHYANKFSLNIT
jgi:hypothetical protein